MLIATLLVTLLPAAAWASRTSTAVPPLAEPLVRARPALLVCVVAIVEASPVTIDPDGNRVQTRTTLPGGPTTTTNFLVDTSGSLSHVVAETDAANALVALYVRGDDLLSVMRPLVPVPASAADWQTRFYHADGLGSVCRLTDESGGITDGYSYDAFGTLIAHTGSDPPTPSPASPSTSTPDSSTTEHAGWIRELGAYGDGSVGGSHL